MNVLIISEPGVDGVLRYVDSLCHFLWDQSVHVHFAYSDCRASDRLGGLVSEVGEHGGRTVNMHTANRPALADGGAFWSLLRLVRTIHPDVIHSHSSKAGVLGRALRFCGIHAAQCYHPHAYIGMRPNHGRFDNVYNKVESVLGRIANTIVVSADEAEFAVEQLKIPASRLHLIPNGVDIETFSPVSLDEKRRLRMQFGLPLDATVLGCIGRSSPQKDPVTLYRAFARAAAERPVVLLHVGTGELDGVLEQMVGELGITDRVYRLSYSSTPADFYRMIDGFVLTSRYEGFSMAVLEAMSANLPLILSDAPGNRDLFAQPLSHRWSAAPGDIDGFARGIIEWHDRIQAVDAEPVNHRRLAKRRFDVRERCGAVLRLYRRLMGSAKSTNTSTDPVPSAQNT